MKFSAIILVSLVGFTVAAPLNVRATSTKAVGSAAGAKATGTAAKGSSIPPPKPKTTDAAADTPASDATTATSSSAAKGAKSSSTVSASGAGPTADYNPGPSTGQTPAAAPVIYAASMFASDATTVSRSLNALGSETDPEMLRSLATVAFTAESDEDQRRNVLNTAAGDTAGNANALIVKNTPAVLTGLQSIMNDPTPDNAKTQVATMEAARNPNILPSITKLSNAAMAQQGLPQMAVVFPLTTGSSGTAGAKGSDNAGN